MSLGGRILYWLFGYFIRREACRLAATTFQLEDGRGYSPRIWALTVFYEKYLISGSEGTREDFGGEEPEEEPKHAPIVQLITRDD